VQYDAGAAEARAVPLRLPAVPADRVRPAVAPGAGPVAVETREPTTPMTVAQPARSDLAALAAEAGIRHVHLFAWRDLDDAEAGGSELHASRVASLWAEAGLDVFMRTSTAQGHRHYPRVHRDGYDVLRRSGRYFVFPHVIASESRGRYGRADAVVDIWNGVPFLTPLWFKGPRVTWLHHVHRNMWEQVLSPRLARWGKFFESSVAPLFYRTTPVVTLSNSSRDEIIRLLRLPAANVTVAPPGVDPRFCPGGEKSPHPLVVGVGRLMPSKRFDEMIRIAHSVRRDVPDLELVIVGDGFERSNLRQLVADLDASAWVRFAGRVSDAELVDLYRRSWVTVSCSNAEGWGMTMTEAAACGTPSVATDIAGHRDSVAPGRSGLLAEGSRQLTADLRSVLVDDELRLRLSEGALKHAREFTWEACAFNAFAPLARQALRQRDAGAGTSIPT
jgi:glycosyltransferase involved in cell wall biosynthesis